MKLRQAQALALIGAAAQLALGQPPFFNQTPQFLYQPPPVLRQPSPILHKPPPFWNHPPQK